VGIKDLEELLELVLVRVVSVLDKDHLLAVCLLSKVDQVHECSLSELVNADVSQPDDKVFFEVILETREAPEGARSIETNAGINFE